MYGDLVPRSELRDRPRFAVAHAWIGAETYALLERAASARRQHPDRLAADILEKVLLGAEQGGFLEV